LHNWVYQYACTGMFSDQLDKMGFRQQVVMGMHPNNPRQKFYGRIRTIRLEIIETEDERAAKGLGFLESLAPGEILCVEGNLQFAYFGEIMARIAARQKLGGVIIGGLTRDSAYTQNLTDLLIFAEGYTPRDIRSRGRLQDIDVPIKIKEVPVNPGDWAFGDRDGIVIIPAKVRTELEQRVIQTIRSETSIAKSIDGGLSIEELLQKHQEF
jgi:4-hydroxy-4-methyl-2-oxoglutarate aldolase